jgi:hypothetical protein
MGLTYSIEELITMSSPVICIFCGWKGDAIQTSFVYGKPNEKGCRIVYNKCPSCDTIETIQKDTGEVIIPIKKEVKYRRKRTEIK